MCKKKKEEKKSWTEIAYVTLISDTIRSHRQKVSDAGGWVGGGECGHTLNIFRPSDIAALLSFRLFFSSSSQVRCRSLGAFPATASLQPPFHGLQTQKIIL